MKESYFEELKTRYLTDADAVNHYANLEDVKRNRVKYGRVTAWAQVLQDFGHSTNTAVWEDRNGCLRIPTIAIDGKKLAKFTDGGREAEEIE